MAVHRRAFTLTELLIALAIVAVLAATLFPVFSSARNAAKKTACLANMHQVSAAALMYVDDYDERFTPTSELPGIRATSRTDRTWVQMLLPYAPSFGSFLCPADTSDHPRLDGSFDQDVVPGDLYAEYYTASQRTNIGFNYMALSPIVRTSDNALQSLPTSYSSIDNPSQTMMYVDSVWRVDANGRPRGGGSWLVEPPCRYEFDGNKVIDRFAVAGYSFDSIFSYWDGWSGLNSGPRPNGGAWPWHTGKMNLIRTDGSAVSVTPGQLAAGCDVKSGWAGSLEHGGQYVWTVNR